MITKRFRRNKRINRIKKSTASNLMLDKHEKNT